MNPKEMEIIKEEKKDKYNLVVTSLYYVLEHADEQTKKTVIAAILTAVQQTVI